MFEQIPMGPYCLHVSAAAGSVEFGERWCLDFRDRQGGNKLVQPHRLHENLPGPLAFMAQKILVLVLWDQSSGHQNIATAMGQLIFYILIMPLLLDAIAL